MAVTVDCAGRVLRLDGVPGQLLGEVGEGYRLAEHLMCSARLRSGAQAVVLLRRLLRAVTAHATAQVGNSRGWLASFPPPSPRMPS